MEPSKNTEVAQSTQVECTIPVLPVRDLQLSIEFYTTTLGFTLDWKGEVTCSVSRDRNALMLSQELKTASPTWAWIGLRSDRLFDEYRAKGVKVYQEPRNEPWAYEMKFEDIDGNVLWLGTGPK